MSERDDKHDKEASGADLRQFPRASLLLKVEYDKTSDFLADTTENISAGGIFIATEGHFEQGQTIRFAVSFPGLLDPIPMHGLVKWSRPAQGDNPAGIGVEFEDGPDSLHGPLGQLLKDLSEASPDQERQPIDFRILLVEDNVVVRDMFRYAIQKLCMRSKQSLHVEVMEADNGQIAWKQLQEQSFHMVIVDLYMPIMDGGQLIQQLRADERLCKLPVMVVSSGGREGRRLAVRSGADVYLDKPIKLKDMMETIETLLLIGHTPKSSDS